MTVSWSPHASSVVYVHPVTSRYFFSSKAQADLEFYFQIYGGSRVEYEYELGVRSLITLLIKSISLWDTLDDPTLPRLTCLKRYGTVDTPQNWGRNALVRWDAVRSPLNAPLREGEI